MVIPCLLVFPRRTYTYLVAYCLHEFQGKVVLFPDEKFVVTTEVLS
jgi:hypothetical protein